MPGAVAPGIWVHRSARGLSALVCRLLLGRRDRRLRHHCHTADLPCLDAAAEHDEIALDTLIPVRAPAAHRAYVPCGVADLRASGIEVLHYYGEGNDAPNMADNDFYRVQQARYIVEPAFVVPLGLHSEVSVGIKGQWSHTGDNEGRFIATIQDTLLGGRDFGQVGGRVAFDVDTRDRPVNPLRGVHLSAAAEVDPAVWDVPSTFGAGEVRAETFASARLPLTPTLALRAGGRKVWGSFPFFESAFLGGVSTLPGYHSSRFAGDASLYGGAQLRLTVGRAFLALPAVWGLYGDVGTGRVYVDEDSPGGWHGGAGGGAWLAFLDRRNAMSIGFASSEEGTIVLAGAAFGL